EGELALAEAAIYLAVAPKSNALYTAYNAARDFVGRDATRPVPMHLRNAPTRLMKDLGYGKGYRYAHDEPDAYAAGERYLPDGMDDLRFYAPVPRGPESRLKDKPDELRALDAAQQNPRRKRPVAVDSAPVKGDSPPRRRDGPP